MTELLKVLKFICRRLIGKVRRIRYKGLYAFLCGITVFAVCFGGNGEELPLKANAAAGSIMLSRISISGQLVPLSDAPAFTARGEIGTESSETKEKEAEAEETAGESPAPAPYNIASGDIVNIEAHSAESTAEESKAEELGADTEAAEDNEAAEPSEEAPADGENGEKRQENNASGVRYVNTDGIYSRKEAAEGSEKVDRYELNEKVTVTKKTDTEYYKLDNGAYIHSDYLSEEETPKWTETEASGTMYVSRDGIYSRKEAVEGSEKVDKYELNEKVTVTKKTDTEYYKLDNGAYIHSDYLSEEETPKWTETETSGTMYVRRGGIYSRKEAVEGSEKLKQYGLNDTVSVTAETNTGYYKLSDGGFIHSDYLSLTETTEYPLSDSYGQRAQSDWEKDMAEQVVEIVNEIRAERGLKPFKQMDSLTAAAAERAWETTFYNSHNRPDGTKCFTVFDEYGLSDPSAKAENIAMWSSSPQAVVNAWMNDYAHMEAILGDYEYIGVGCYYIESDYYKYYWSQLFYTP
ncbi:MAG: CAP domain-containing protein [Bacteroides sp.]|nr:CAP domain-containing protein [Bacteroides sp.]